MRTRMHTHIYIFVYVDLIFRAVLGLQKNEQKVCRIPIDSVHVWVFLTRIEA